MALFHLTDKDNMKLAIIVPYRNRQKYVDILLDLYPKYLHQNDIFDYKIYISEQLDSYQFNSAISRNVGAKYALAQAAYKYMLFNDVDIVPVSGVNLNYNTDCVAYVMNGGGLKITTELFQSIKGYSTLYNGWGCEEEDIWQRLRTLDKEPICWVHVPESKNAKIINLELDIDNEKDSYDRSKFEFWGAEGPKYIPFPLKSIPEVRSEHRSGGSHAKNLKILEFVKSLSKEQMTQYCETFGLDQINLDKVKVKYDTPNVCWIQYDRVDVLK